MPCETIYKINEGRPNAGEAPALLLAALKLPQLFFDHLCTFMYLVPRVFKIGCPRILCFGPYPSLHHLCTSLTDATRSNIVSVPSRADEQYESCASVAPVGLKIDAESDLRLASAALCKLLIDKSTNLGPVYVERDCRLPSGFGVQFH